MVLYYVRVGFSKIGSLSFLLDLVGNNKFLFRHATFFFLIALFSHATELHIIWIAVVNF